MNTERDKFAKRNLPKSTYDIYNTVNNMNKADIEILSHLEYVDIYNKYVAKYIMKADPFDFYASRDINKDKQEKVLKAVNKKASTICLNCRYINILTNIFTSKEYTHYFGLAQALGYKSIAEFVTAAGIAPVKAAIEGGAAGVLGGGITKAVMSPAKAGIKSAKSWRNNIKNNLNDTEHNLDNRFGGEKNGWDKDGRSYYIDSEWLESSDGNN